MLIDHFHNPDKHRGSYAEELKSVLDIEKAKVAFEEIKSWDGYSETPLHSLKNIASNVGVSDIYYKDESHRFELGSFKALGGTYGVLKLLQNVVSVETGDDVTTEDVRQGRYAENISNYTVTTATDGNHGRAVALGAKLFGCNCVIYIHSEVSLGRQKAMENLNATVVRVSGNYDDSLKACILEADKNAWHIISDTSYDGYTKYPSYIMAGYTVMAEEIITQIKSKPRPTHVFLQAGVGSFPGAICAYFWERFADPNIRFIVVESMFSACLMKSARNGEITSVYIEQETMMAGLSCGEPSLLGWNILSVGADDFVTIDDGTVPGMMRLLARNNPKIEAGESAVAGLAALIDISKNSEIARKIGLNPDSVILLFGTEGATDQAIYRSIVENGK